MIKRREARFENLHDFIDELSDEEPDLEADLIRTEEETKCQVVELD